MDTDAHTRMLQGPIVRSEILYNVYTYSSREYIIERAREIRIHYVNTYIHMVIALYAYTLITLMTLITIIILNYICIHILTDYIDILSSDVSEQLLSYKSCMREAARRVRNESLFLNPDGSAEMKMVLSSISRAL